MLGRLQAFLQGTPTKRSGWKYRPRPWWVVRLGNWLSSLRYWAWRAAGGKH